MKRLPYDKVKQLIPGEGSGNTSSNLETVLNTMATFAAELRKDEDYFDSDRWDESLYKVPLSSQEIQKFLYSLLPYAREDWLPRVGRYISTLLNASTDGIISLEVPPHLKKLHNVGNELCQKEVTLRGSVGPFFGNLMHSGTLRLEGSADYLAGMDMDGGHLIVTQDVKDELGGGKSGGLLEVYGSAKSIADQKGGTIHIRGNCNHIGGESYDNITGGIIRVDGRIGKINFKYITGGDIYHQGNLIVQDGKRVK